MPDIGVPLPIDLRVCGLENPVGVPHQPTFGWHIQDARVGALQTHYQLLVATSEANLASEVADLWDSGKVASDRQGQIYYDGAPLSSTLRCHWKVRSWGREGEPGPFSAPAHFTVGLIRQEAWVGASWIRRDTTEPDEYSYFRGRFELPTGQISQATLYVTAVHRYELWVNGLQLGTGPSYHYPQFQYYNSYDVTAHLHGGAETLLALATRWFGPGQGRPASERGLLAKLVVSYADGRSFASGSDGDWRCQRATAWRTGQPPRHPHEGVGYVETLDAARLTPGWNQPAFDDGEWERVKVIGPAGTAPWNGILQPDLSRIVEYPISPATIAAHGNGCYMVDLGKVYAGRPRIAFSGGVASDLVRMEGGYTLRGDGTIDPATTQHTDMRYGAILDGGEFVFLPAEYLGMRYLQIEGSPMPITPDTFAFIVRHAPLNDVCSTFASSHPTLDAVWSLMKHSLTLGAQEQFLDTPTREKGGFLLDSVNQSLAAMAVFGERVLTRKTLHEFLDSMEQHWSDPADWGRINAVYPNGDGARDIPDFTQAYLVWVWWYYLYTGDIGFLQAHYPRLRAVADYVERHRRGTTGLIHELTGGSGPYTHGIIDWPPSMRYGYDMRTEARTVINAHAFADFDIIARIAAELGHLEDERYYRALADSLQAAINQHLLNADGVYSDGLLADGTPSAHLSQQANALPLALGIVPTAHRASVLAHIQALGMHSGMVTVMWLIRALGEAGAGSTLLELYTNAEQDGWAQTLAQGGTCTWESWDAAIGGGDLSLSHPWGAVGLLGIHHYVLGVMPLAPQFAQVRIKPLHFGRQLTHASGTLPTERGPLKVEWERDEGSFTLSLHLPPNMRAQLHLPLDEGAQATLTCNGLPWPARRDGRYLVVDDIGSGIHHFSAYEI